MLANVAVDVLGLLLTQKEEAQNASPEVSDLDPVLVAEIEALVEQVMGDGSVPGAAIGIVKDGELAYARGFGVAELGSDDPVTPESIFNMASITKTAVGMAIMQLVDEGKIDLDAEVTGIYPILLLRTRSRGNYRPPITVTHIWYAKSGRADRLEDKNR